MKFLSIKIIFVAAFLFVSTSVLAINSYSQRVIDRPGMLPKGMLKSTLKYYINNFIKKSDNFDYINFKDQALTFSVGMGVLKNLQLDLSYDGINFYNFKQNEKNNILSDLGKIEAKSHLLSIDNYRNSINVIIPINFAKIIKGTKVENDYFVKNIILNNANTYIFNKNLRLTALHKNFVDIKFNKKVYGVKITAPIVLHYQATDAIYFNLATRLASWDIDSKNIESKIQSLWDKVPTSLNVIYAVSSLFDINASISMTAYPKKMATSELKEFFSIIYKGFSPLGVNVGISYRQSIA